MEQIFSEQVRINDEIIGSDGESIGKVTAFSVGASVVRVQVDKAGTVAYAKEHPLKVNRKSGT